MRRVLAHSQVVRLARTLEIVLVFGSRSWRDWALINEHLRPLPLGTTVVHGAARGADAIAGKLARRRGLQVIAEPIRAEEWAALGNGAGPARNQRMLDRYRVTRGLGFVSGPSGSPLTRGSADMLERLQRARLPVLLVRSDGRVSAWEPSSTR